MGAPLLARSWLMVRARRMGALANKRCRVWICRRLSCVRLGGRRSGV